MTRRCRTRRCLMQPGRPGSRKSVRRGRSRLQGWQRTQRLHWTPPLRLASWRRPTFSGGEEIGLWALRRQTGCRTGGADPLPVGPTRRSEPGARRPGRAPRRSCRRPHGCGPRQAWNRFWKRWTARRRRSLALRCPGIRTDQQQVPGQVFRPTDTRRRAPHHAGCARQIVPGTRSCPASNAVRAVLRGLIRRSRRRAGTGMVSALCSPNPLRRAPCPCSAP